MQVPSIEGRLTTLGNLVVEQTEDGHVVVEMKARDHARLRYSVADVDGVVRLDMWSGAKPPRPGDEIQANGKSLEVVRVYVEGGEAWAVCDNGEKVRV